MEIYYEDIYKDIKKDIIDGKTGPGDKLASENELCQKYGVSRNTVRRAFKMLADEGIATSVKGKGVFVLNSVHNKLKSITSFEGDSNETIKMKNIVEIIADKKIAEKTNFSEGMKLINIIKIKKINGENTVIENSYFNAELIHGLDKNIVEKSVYNYIENELSLKIFGQQKSIIAKKIKSKDKKYLKLKDINCIVVERKNCFLENGQQFEFTELRYHPERFSFTTFIHR